MVVDFQHHFTPRELFAEDLGDRRILTYDAAGTPSYISHRLLYDLDAHIEIMDICGVDAAVLTSLAGMVADLERSKFINDKAKEAERASIRGASIGAACYVHPMGGGDAMQELALLRTSTSASPAWSSARSSTGSFSTRPSSSRFGSRSANGDSSSPCSRRSSSTSPSSSTSSTPRARSGASSR